MKKQINYPKIQQFRNVISTIRRQSTFTGLDKNGDAIYDKNKRRPILRFIGTVKLHGTNAGVSYNLEDGFWFQSRNKIITPEVDNAGFAFFANTKQAELHYLIHKLNIDVNLNTITVYGEWAGGNIQKGVGLNQIEKSFFIFGVKVTPKDESNSYWLDISKLKFDLSEHNIYSIYQFKNYSINVDFNCPENIQQKLIDLTNQVEEKCPITEHFGFEGIGEGIVWHTEFNGVVHRFKVKGQKHSTSNVKVLAAVDVDKIKNIREFVDYAVTENRFEQSLKEIFGEEEVNINKLGLVIKWNINDINKEESDVMVKNGLFPKDVNKDIAQKIKEMFLNKI